MTAVVHRPTPAEGVVPGAGGSTDGRWRGSSRWRSAPAPARCWTTCLLDLARSPVVGGRPLDVAAAAAEFADQGHLTRLFHGRVRDDAGRVAVPPAERSRVRGRRRATSEA